MTADLVGSRDSFTLDDAAGWVERAMDASRDRKWAITIDGSDDAVGFVALFGLDRQTGPELAVLVGEPRRGGRASPARPSGRPATTPSPTTRTHRVHAEIPATNVAAQKVVTFLGFRREGVMKDAIVRDGEAIDNEIWGLLPEDFTGWDEGAKRP